MEEKTPFDDLVTKDKKTEFYLLRINEWEWTKTEDISLDSPVPFYDYSPNGRLISGESECPLCECTIGLSAGFDESGNCAARDWVCLGCGIGGDIEAGFGLLQTTTNEDHDEVLLLPRCVVVEVELD